MADDWDTSGNTEQAVDEFNKSSFEKEVASVTLSEEVPTFPTSVVAVVEDTTSPIVAEVEDTTPPIDETLPSSIAETPPPIASTPPPPVEIKAPSPEAPSISAPKAHSTSSPGSARKDSNARRGSAPPDAPDFLKGESTAGSAFTEKLDPEALKFFNELCEKPFAEQAVSFLNAYWNEVGNQSEFIFTVAYDMIRYADMHAKGVQYIHLYKEGNDLDFNIGLYFYEKLCKKVLDDDEGARWRDDPAFAQSMPLMMTAIKRKIELREKVDCNFDGRVSFLEYLLYQYQDCANPADFTFRAMKTDHLEEHPEIVKARLALAEVNEAIQAYEAEKHRLTELSEKPGVKGLGAKHQLAILGASPLAETLNMKLIKAEAAVRMATRKFGSGKVVVSSQGGSDEHRKPTEGSMWWLNRDLEEKKKLYGKR